MHNLRMHPMALGHQVQGSKFRVRVRFRVRDRVRVRVRSKDTAECKVKFCGQG